MSELSHELKWTMSMSPSDAIASKNEELSLTVRSEQEYGHGVSCSTRLNHESKNMTLDVNSVDILGPAEVVKKLFCLPVTTEEPYFALHRMGNTLLIDSIVGLDEKAPMDHESTPLSKHSPQITLFSPDRPHGTGNDLMIDTLKNSTVSQMISDSQQSSHNSAFPLQSFSSTATAGHNTISSLDSPFLPPPGFYVPQCPPPLPFRHLLRWQLQNLRFAMGSDLMVYSAHDHPMLTVAPMDTTRDVELSTCVDQYLDNVMANVPELALCLHAKGFLRGISICRTEDIPRLNCTMHSHIQQSGWDSSSKHSTGSGTHKTRQASTSSSSSTASAGREGGGGLFDPKVIEFNALTILRFLKENCDRDNGTYIVHMQRPSGKESTSKNDKDDTGTIQIYDLQSISLARQKKWKWLLAMLSQRFAMRLGHHYGDASPPSRVIIRDRQMSLFKSCYDLLTEIQQMGGGKHGTIRASVLEQMADIRLAKADSRRRQKCSEHYDSSCGAPAPTAAAAVAAAASGGGSGGGDAQQKGPQVPSEHVEDSSIGKRKQKKHKNRFVSSAGRSTRDALSRDCPVGNDGGVVRASPREASTSSHHTSSGESIGELDSIDITEEMLESVQILQRAMSDLLESIHSSNASEVEDVLRGAESAVMGKSIMIGDVACETVPVPVDEADSMLVSTVTGSTAPIDEGLSDSASCTVDVTLALQYSGLLHKTMVACISVVRHMLQSHSGHCGEAIIAETIRILSALIPFCTSWIDVTAKLKTLIMHTKESARARKKKRKENLACGGIGSAEPCRSKSPECASTESVLTLHLPSVASTHWQSCCHSFPDDYMMSSSLGDDDETMHDFWGIDRTILADMPLLWDVLGEICRELSCRHRMNLSLNGGKRGGSGGSDMNEWSLWDVHGVHIKRLASCFTAMVVQASSFAPMRGRLSAVFDIAASHLPTTINQVRETKGTYEGDTANPDKLATELDHHDCGDVAIDIDTIDLLCSELCGGRQNMLIDISSPVVPTLLSLFCKVTPCVVQLLPHDSAVSSIGGGRDTLSPMQSSNEDGLVETLKIQNYSFVVAAILAAREESGWSKTQWMCRALVIDDESSDMPQPQLMLRITRAERGIETHLGQIIRHLGDASNELGQQLYRRAMTCPIEIQSTSSPAAYMNGTAESLQPLYDAFSHGMLFQCQAVDFFYDVSLALFSYLCQQRHSHNAPSLASACKESQKLGEMNDNVSDMRNRVTVQCNMSSLRRSLSARFADAILTHLSPSIVSASSGITASAPVVDCADSSSHRAPDDKKSASMHIDIIDAKEKPVQKSLSSRDGCVDLSSIIANAMEGVILTPQKGAKYRVTKEMGACSASGGKKKKKVGTSKLSRLGEKGQGVNDTTANFAAATPGVNRKALFANNLLKSALQLRSPLEYLDDAIRKCTEDHISSDSANQPVGYVLQSECGLNYLAKGLLHRKCFTAKDIHIPTLISLSDNKHVELARTCLERALEIFQRVPTSAAARQEAALHYHLGSLHHTIWGRCVAIADFSQQSKEYDMAAVAGESGDKHLELTMSHYSNAHQYFLKYDVGPTLAAILLDMSEIYLTSYGSREGNIQHELTKLSLSTPTGSSSAGAAAADTAATTASTIIAIRTTVSSLLGGAFRSLVDCRRFLLTTVVVERHGRYMVEHGVIDRLRRSLLQLMLKMIKVLGSICYDDDKKPYQQHQQKKPVHDSGHSGANNRNDAIAILKKTYKDLLVIGDVDPNMSNMAKIVNTICVCVDQLNSSDWLVSLL